MRVLIIDVSGDRRDRLVDCLEGAGHQVVLASSLSGARRSLHRDEVDAVVTARSLPDGDAFDFVEERRALGCGRPILAVSSADAVADRVAGLRAGLDDHLGDPFAPEELLARLDAVARRAGLAGELEVGPLRISRSRHTVELEGNAVELTAREFDLLVSLARHSPGVRSRAQLLDEVWNVGSDPGSNLVDVYIRYLRSKLGDGLIRTVRGVGYALDPQQARLRQGA